MVVLADHAEGCLQDFSRLYWLWQSLFFLTRPATSTCQPSSVTLPSVGRRVRSHADDNLAGHYISTAEPWLSFSTNLDTCPLPQVLIDITAYVIGAAQPSRQHQWRTANSFACPILPVRPDFVRNMASVEAVGERVPCHVRESSSIVCAAELHLSLGVIGLPLLNKKSSILTMAQFAKHTYCRFFVLLASDRFLLEKAPTCPDHTWLRLQSVDATGGYSGQPPSCRSAPQLRPGLSELRGRPVCFSWPTGIDWVCAAQPRPT